MKPLLLGILFLMLAGCGGAPAGGAYAVSVWAETDTSNAAWIGYDCVESQTGQDAPLLDIGYVRVEDGFCAGEVAHGCVWPGEQWLAIEADSNNNMKVISHEVVHILLFEMGYDDLDHHHKLTASCGL